MHVASWLCWWFNQEETWEIARIKSCNRLPLQPTSFQDNRTPNSEDAERFSNIALAEARPSNVQMYKSVKNTLPNDLSHHHRLNDLIMPPNIKLRGLRRFFASKMQLRTSADLLLDVLARAAGQRTRLPADAFGDRATGRWPASADSEHMHQSALHPLVLVQATSANETLTGYRDQELRLCVMDRRLAA